jgi:hypothetical protein
LANEEQTRPSKVIPHLVAALVCDAAATDPTTRKKSLIGIFDRLWVGRFPTQRPVSVYIKLTDAEGEYSIEVRFVQVSSGQALAGATGRVRIDNRLTSVDMVLQSPPLTIPAEGRYEFQIYANDIYLGGTFIDVFPRPSQPIGG